MNWKTPIFGNLNDITKCYIDITPSSNKCVKCVDIIQRLCYNTCIEIEE